MGNLSAESLLEARQLVRRIARKRGMDVREQVSRDRAVLRSSDGMGTAVASGLNDLKYMCVNHWGRSADDCPECADNRYKSWRDGSPVKLTNSVKPLPWQTADGLIGGNVVKADDHGSAR